MDAAKPLGMFIDKIPAIIYIGVAGLIVGWVLSRYGGGDTKTVVSSAPVVEYVATAGASIEYILVARGYWVVLSTNVKVVRHVESGCLLHMQEDRNWMVPVYLKDSSANCQRP